MSVIVSDGSLFLAYAALLQASLMLPLSGGVRVALFGTLTSVSAVSGAEWLALHLSARLADVLGVLQPL